MPITPLSAALTGIFFAVVYLVWFWVQRHRTLERRRRRWLEEGR